MNFSDLLDTIIVAAIIGAMWLLSNWSERRPGPGRRRIPERWI